MNFKKLSKKLSKVSDKVQKVVDSTKKLPTPQEVIAFVKSFKEDEAAGLDEPSKKTLKLAKAIEDFELEDGQIVFESAMDPVSVKPDDIWVWLRDILEGENPIDWNVVDNEEYGGEYRDEVGKANYDITVMGGPWGSGDPTEVVTFQGNWVEAFHEIGMGHFDAVFIPKGEYFYSDGEFNSIEHLSAKNADEVLEEMLEKHLYGFGEGDD